MHPAEKGPLSVPEVGAPAKVRPADTDTVFLGDDDPLAEESNSAQTSSHPASPVRPVLLRPGELIPGTRYRLVRWLGDGGMGTVFEAVHEDLDRRVALKVLRDAFSASILTLFRKEAKTLGRLGSRFVVDVYDLIELDDGRLMIAMELLQGQNLRDVLDQVGPLPMDRIISIGRQICKGLGAAHDAGIVHRDVKPENISLEVIEGRRDAVKLLDFGIAQVGDNSEDTESRAGTPGYLAPEVITGVGGDLRADIYALGCTLYELATGRRPFERKFISDVLVGHVSEVPEPPSLHMPCPPAFDAVVLRCLEKDPAKRYPDAASLEAGLCEVQIAQGIQTTWDDLPLPAVDAEAVARLQRKMPAPRLAKRRWLPWTIAGTLVVAVAAGWAGYALRSEPTASAPYVAEVDALVDGARGAAARAFFVYPPPEEPDLRTALGFVAALESIDGEAADYGLERAAELRQEFADTLERLGDDYWQQDGGKPFALDYYAEALMFDPTRTTARQRASMTPGELRLLRSKAESGSFTQDELVEVEPLIALADIPDEDRTKRMASIATKSPRAEQRTHQLRSVAKARGIEAEVPLVAQAEPDPFEAEDDIVLEDDALLDVGAVPSEEELDDTHVADPALARDRTKAADAAHRKGDSARAEKLYSEALAADHTHAAAHRGLGRVEFDRGNYALAARRLKKAVRLAPRNAGYRIELGDALYKSFDYDGAYAQYLRAKDLGSSLAAGRLKKVDGKR